MIGIRLEESVSERGWKCRLGFNRFGGAERVAESYKPGCVVMIEREAVTHLCS